MSRHTVFRFNMIEIALALVILAIGLSSVLVLFPIGLEAGKSSVTDNNLSNVAELVMAYLQSELTAPANWNNDGTVSNVSKAEFTEEDSDIPVGDAGFSEVTGMDGLLKKTVGAGAAAKTFYIYRQYSDIEGSGIAAADRAVDFEAMIRYGLDTATLKEQYYPVAGESAAGDVAGQRQLTNYARPSDPATAAQPANTKLNVGIDDLLEKCYKTLIVEFSWPVDAPWEKREKRVFRLELFNENFVPYPKSTP